MPAGSIAYVDRDWLPAARGPVSSLTVASDGALAWCGGPPVRGASKLNPETRAALLLLAVAKDAAAAVEGVPSASVAVTGKGLIAQHVREMVGCPAAARGAERPAAIVETTGDPGVIVEATRTLSDQGTLVLVGEALGRQLDMNLYPDVHRRGLTLIGVARPLQEPGALAAAPEEDLPVRRSCELLASVRSGEPLVPDATWYAVSGV